jgi:hypothetical protein
MDCKIAFLQSPIGVGQIKNVTVIDNTGEVEQPVKVRQFCGKGPMEAASVMSSTRVSMPFRPLSDPDRSSFTSVAMTVAAAVAQA